MLFLAIARLASLLILLGQYLVQSSHVQSAWIDGPPSFAHVDNIILYWTATHDCVQIDLKYGAQRSTGIFRYRERPFPGQESLCINNRNGRIITYGFKMSSFSARGDFTLDIWPFGFQSLAAQLTFTPSDFSCFRNKNKDNAVVARCKWNPPAGDNRFIAF